MSNIKVGILGGTFNPIHNGHILLAQKAFDFCDLSKVLIMPTGCSYLKDQRLILPKMDRINMVKLAITGCSYFELSEIETNKEGNTYTFETLKELNEVHPDWLLHFIIGADTLYSIETWKNPQDIFDRAVIIAAKRNHHSDKELIKQSNYLKDKFNARIIFLDSDDIDISSSEIREFIKKNKSVKEMVPYEVLKYIESKGLYK